MTKDYGAGENCPERDKHWQGEIPSGYVARAEWATEMLKTHKQERCPGCGLYKIWKPKEPKRVSR